MGLPFGAQILAPCGGLPQRSVRLVNPKPLKTILQRKYPDDECCQMSQMVQDAFWKALLSNRFYNTQITRSPPAPGLSSVPISSLPISNRAARMSLMRFDIKVSSLSHISFKAGVVRTLWFNALLQLSSHDSLVELRLVDDGGTVLRRAGVGLAFPNGGSKSIHIHRHQERHGRAASLI